MAVNGRKILRLQRGSLGCVAVCLCAALITPPAWAAEGSAPLVPAPEKGPTSVSGPASPTPGENEIRSLREQIAQAPDDVLPYVRLGYLLLNAGAPAEAKTAFDEALKRNGHSHAALTGEGIILARAGNLKEAEQVLKSALVRNPDPVRTHYELGLVYEKEGDLEKALAEYKEGIAKYQQGRK